MNNKDFLTKLSAKTGYSLEDTQKLVQSVIKTMGKKLEKGDSIQINSFGIFAISFTILNLSILFCTLISNGVVIVPSSRYPNIFVFLLFLSYISCFIREG